MSAGGAKRPGRPPWGVAGARSEMPAGGAKRPGRPPWGVISARSEMPAGGAIIHSLVDAPEIVLLSVVLWIAWSVMRRRDDPLAERAVPLIGGFVVLGANLFPWSVVWLVPFLAVAPSMPWIALTGTVAFAYAFFLSDPWAIPAWAARVIEFGPLAASAVWGLARRCPLLLLEERSA